LKLQSDLTLSDFAFSFNLRRYFVVKRADGDVAAGGGKSEGAAVFAQGGANPSRL
jgi:hypothetical protein